MFGRGHGGDYMSLFTYRGPRWSPRPRLACNAPKMTLRQICRMLRIMRQLRIKEAAAAAAAARKQGSPAVTPKSPTVKSERRCLPACFRRRRSNNIKRTGLVQTTESKGGLGEIASSHEPTSDI
ncbi:hypothetical protein E1301_Tti003798 [Triplophysa tibetana]|uniref:Uncharacterized protein n=1 Tax=Triplophysa tibetana TaxID=1572043 RepID=A0A5A9PQR9_9TELE|nr:hypothetical protein E1301_Tti003798 [Triplophysa tibetana]